MGSCPFCKESVDDAILEYGGRCPSCLIEIPGEDAPTDPGEEAKAAMQAKEAAAASKSRRPLAAALIVGALAAAVLGYVVLAPGDAPTLAKVETGAEAYRRVSSSFLTIDLDDEEDIAPADEAVAKAPAKSSSKKRTDSPKPSSNGATLGGAAAVPELGDDNLDAVAQVDLQDADVAEEKSVPQATAGAASEDPMTAGIPTITRAGGGGGSMDPGAGPRKRGVKAQEYCDDQIRDVAKALMGQLKQPLTRCAERVIKRDESFQSAVKVAIAVEKDGRIAAIDLRPSNTDDAEFLGCLEKTIKKTTFPRFCEGVDLTKTYYFGSQR